MRARCDVLLVGHQENGLPPFVELVKNAHDLLACATVEVSGGFVRQDDGGVVGQGPSDGHTLALAAGKLIGLVRHTVSQPDSFEQVRGPLTPPSAPLAGVDQGKLHVVECRRTGQEVKRLKDEPDLAVADLGKGIVVHPTRQLPVECVGSCRGAVQAAKNVEERRLARPGWPHDGHVLVLLDLQIQVAEGVDRLGPHLVGFGDSLEDDTHGHHS